VASSSGAYTFLPSNGECVLAAFERVYIRAPELRQEHMLTARRELNMLFVEWSNRQPNLWLVVRNQVVLTPGIATITLPSQTVLVLDASIVLNFGTANESRRYITPISRTEYLSYANQQTPGPPTVWWMDRLIAPTLTFYPVPDSNGPYTFDYFSCTQMQDANLAGGEIPYVPYRWVDALVNGLTARFARLYPPPPSMDALAFRKLCKDDAEESWKIAAAQDIEPTPLVLSPSLVGYYRR